jgi:hypothetical protein
MLADVSADGVVQSVTVLTTFMQVLVTAAVS